jgi:exonuclease SbcC
MFQYCLKLASDVANVRFHQAKKSVITTINSSTEFEVIDYLNNNAQRSVKHFRVVKVSSLCLAHWRKRAIRYDKLLFLSMKV